MILLCPSIKLILYFLLAFSWYYNLLYIQNFFSHKDMAFVVSYKLVRGDSVTI